MDWDKFREIIESKLSYLMDEKGIKEKIYVQTIQDRCNRLEMLIKESIIETQDDKANLNAESSNSRINRMTNLVKVNSTQEQRIPRSYLSTREALHGGIKNVGKRGRA